jgi:hypothetical protein
LYSRKKLTDSLSSQSISHVSVIIRQAYPLSRQLDQDAGEIVLRKIEAIGVHVLTNCCLSEQLTRLADDESGDEIFTGLQLQDGTTSKLQPFNANRYAMTTDYITLFTKVNERPNLVITFINVYQPRDSFPNTYVFPILS